MVTLAQLEIMNPFNRQPASSHALECGDKPCTLHAFRRLGMGLDWQSQRDCGSKPKVGAPRLPWEGGWRFQQPQRGCGPDATRLAATPLGLLTIWQPIPRVAPWAQPWAGGQNPVGIREVNGSSRKTLDMFAGNSCKVQDKSPLSNEATCRLLGKRGCVRALQKLRDRPRNKAGNR
jgi:hypothetical protein